MMRASELLREISRSYQDILGSALVGIYVHGSLAFGCFNPEKSDIDFLAVVSRKLRQAEKEALISELLRLDKYAPPKGLEMSVITDAACRPFVWPTPFELHFSNTHKVRAAADLSGFCASMNGTDTDLAAHITVIRQVGIRLYGRDISEVFAPVPETCYLESILEDVRDAGERISGDPVYYVLNLCRVLAYVESGLVLSKKQGGEWALERLPGGYAPVIRSALGAYSGDAVFSRDELLRDFVGYVSGLLQFGGERL